MNLTYTLKHLFTPAQSNNHKAKALHNSTIFILIIGMIFYQVFLQVLPTSGVKVLGFAAQISTSDVIALTNQKRADNGLSVLFENVLLSRAAQEKGAHMLAHDYWAHIAPDGTQPWKFFNDAGYKYRYAGENLARDFSSASLAVEAWMDSPSHRENLLSSKYNEIGIAVVEGDLGGVDTTIIVQLFGSTYSEGSTPQIAVAPTQEPLQIAQVIPTRVPTQIPEPTATIVPTLIPTVVPQIIITPVTQGGQVLTESNNAQVLISPFTTTKQISLVTGIVLLVVLAIDAVLIRKKKIIRMGGKTIAHLLFLGMIVAIVLIIRAGSIL